MVRRFKPKPGWQSLGLMAGRDGEDEGLINKLADFIQLNAEKRWKFHDKIAPALLFYRIAISNKPDVKSKKPKRNRNGLKGPIARAKRR